MANGNGNGSGGSLGQYYSPITNQLYPMASDNTTNPLMPPTYAGDPEAAGAAQASSMMAPAVKSYLSDVFSGRMFERGMERYFGQPTPDSSQPLSQQANLTMDSPAVNIALSFGPGIMAGEKAATAGVDSLAQATKLEAGGYSRKEVFDQTGWFRGPGGQSGPGSEWQFTVPDKGAKLKTENLEQTERPGIWDEDEGTIQREQVQHIPISMGASDIKLNDVLDHPALFEAYPQLKDITVRPLNEWQGRGGFTGGDINTMWLSPQPAEGFLSSMMHETQHAVQEIEGFPRGGTPSEFLPPDFSNQYSAAQDARDMLARNIHVSGFDPETVAKEHGFWPNREPIPEAQGHSEGLDPSLIKDYGEASKQLGALEEQRITGRNNYLSLGGEVQSRATEAMLRNQRWDLLPEESGQVAHDRWGNLTVEPYTPPSQQLIRYDLPSGSASALPEPPPGWGYTPVDHDPFAGGPQ